MMECPYLGFSRVFHLWYDIKIFADSPTDVQQSIANHVGLKFSQIRTYLEVAVVLRNYCAHYNRLYYTSFTKNPWSTSFFLCMKIVS